MTTLTSTIMVNPIGCLQAEIDISELTVLADGEQKQNNCGCFRILSQKDGDKRVVWRRESIPEINAAHKLFSDLVTQGMVPYRVGINGNASSDVMREFDPTAEEVIFLPMRMIVGG